MVTLTRWELAHPVVRPSVARITLADRQAQAAATAAQRMPTQVGAPIRRPQPALDSASAYGGRPVPVYAQGDHAKSHPRGCKCSSEQRTALHMTPRARQRTQSSRWTTANALGLPDSVRQMGWKVSAPQSITHHEWRLADV